MLLFAWEHKHAVLCFIKVLGSFIMECRISEIASSARARPIWPLILVLVLNGSRKVYDNCKDLQRTATPNFPGKQ